MGTLTLETTKKGYEIMKTYDCSNTLDFIHEYNRMRDTNFSEWDKLPFVKSFTQKN